MAQKTGMLYLIPTLLAEDNYEEVIPKGNIQIIHHLESYIVENIRSARRFLVKLNLPKTIDELQFFELNKHTPMDVIPEFIQPLLQGEDVGLLSEAGIPAVADPGSQVVQMAHEYSIRVVPLIGPNSIVLALAASGLNGQSFVFHGYLPIRTKERATKIKTLESNSKNTGATQIFIEAPYRNNQMLQEIIKTCTPNTLLCIAADITGTNEYIKTLPVSLWKNHLPNLHKRPAVFLLLGNN